jgi:hypothetical protein
MYNSFIVSIKSNSQDYEQIKSTWDFCFVFAKLLKTIRVTTHQRHQPHTKQEKYEHFFQKEKKNF